MTESQVDRAGAAGAAPDIAPLLEPVRIGRLWLRNRFVMPGMQRFGCVDGAPSERLREYYRRRALGGTALVIAEACAVDHPSSASNGVFARIDASTRDAWRACVDAVHDVGGRMFLQLWHAGAVDTGGRDIAADFIALSPSGLAHPGKPFGRPASAAELAAIKDAFVRGAVIAVGSVGLDVDVMATLNGTEARPTGATRIEDLVRRFRRGDFDLVSIGRSLIGDPDWVAKMRDGRGAQIRPFRRADLEWLSALARRAA